MLQSIPQSARTPVWALPLSLAATNRIDVSFSSSPYLDVSVQEVPDLYLCIQYRTTEVCSARFPHSEICGSLNICFLPQLIAAYHVFHRLSVPRHPPYALYSLTWQIWKRSELIDESVLNACIHKLIYWLIRNHLRSKGYEENEVFRITAANRPSFIILKMMYSVTPFGFLVDFSTWFVSWFDIYFKYMSHLGCLNII